MADPIEKWRAPAVVQVKAVAGAVIGIAVAAVFFPVPIAAVVAVLLAAWGVGMGARRPEVRLDPGPEGDSGPAGGTLTVTMGFVARRVALADISAIGLESPKVIVRRADGTEISVHAWQRGPLDRWLRVPDIAADMAHAISKAASVARPGKETRPAGGETEPGKAGTGTVARVRSGRNLPLAVMAVAGVIEIAAVFFVRVSWPSPVMTALGALVALAFGVTGMFTVVFSLWTYLMSRPGAARRARG